MPDRASKGCYTQGQLRSVRPERYAPIKGFAPVLQHVAPRFTGVQPEAVPLHR